MSTPPSISFKVVPPRTKGVTAAPPAFVLEQDNWNDYSFQTQYHLSYYAPSSAGAVEVTSLGPVKILRRGQTKADGLLVKSDFQALDSQFCSVGQSLDYYERARELGEVGRAALEALRDVVANPTLVSEFETEEGWATSLFRDQRDKGEKFRYLAAGLVSGHYLKAPEDKQAFAFHVEGWQAPVSFDTSSGEAWDFESPRLPERVNVLVGRNGSGKSTLLARLARVAYGSPSERTERPLKQLGKLSPEGVGFPRIVTVAFSPFDSFKIPGSDDRNRLQIAKDLQRGVGRFAFIGLRDFSAEVDLSGVNSQQPEIGVSTEASDRVTQTRLKSIEQLADEFEAFRMRIQDKDRGLVLQKALRKLERGMFSETDGSAMLTQPAHDVRSWFLGCSTGHKITLLVTFGLVACLEFNSLVLIDEPETHLHPPLLAAMMHGLRGILKDYESIAVVATHSPVVVQESMARHVHVVRREGDLTSVLPVSTETFGESIGHITAQVFGMESNATDFHKVLDSLVEKYKTLESIEALFMDGIMSHQARAYVLSRLSSPKQS